jgi:RNA polymerase sigma-70 factor (ECF subfamily)
VGLLEVRQAPATLPVNSTDETADPPDTSDGDGVTVDGNHATRLVRQAQAEDPLAWQRLMALCLPLVGYWARGAGLQPHDRDDLCQEVFRSVARRLAGFRPDGDGDGFRSWLWTITRNKLRDFFRLRRRQFLPSGGEGGLLLNLADRPAEPEDPGPGAADPVVRRALEVLATEFEERTRLAFWRSAVEEQPAADVGAGLAMSATAVRQARSRVLHRLRQELAVGRRPAGTRPTSREGTGRLAGERSCDLIPDDEQRNRPGSAFVLEDLRRDP